MVEAINIKNSGIPIEPQTGGGFKIPLPKGTKPEEAQAMINGLTSSDYTVGGFTVGKDEKGQTFISVPADSESMIFGKDGLVSVDSDEYSLFSSRYSAAQERASIATLNEFKDKINGGDLASLTADQQKEVKDALKFVEANKDRSPAVREFYDDFQVEMKKKLEENGMPAEKTQELSDIEKLVKALVSMFAPELADTMFKGGQEQTSPAAETAKTETKEAPAAEGPTKTEVKEASAPSTGNEVENRKAALEKTKTDLEQANKDLAKAKANVATYTAVTAAFAGQDGLQDGESQAIDNLAKNQKLVEELEGKIAETTANIESETQWLDKNDPVRIVEAETQPAAPAAEQPVVEAPVQNKSLEETVPDLFKGSKYSVMWDETKDLLPVLDKYEANPSPENRREAVSALKAFEEKAKDSQEKDPRPEEKERYGRIADSARAQLDEVAAGGDINPRAFVGEMLVEGKIAKDADVMTALYDNPAVAPEGIAVDQMTPPDTILPDYAAMDMEGMPQPEPVAPVVPEPLPDYAAMDMEGMPQPEPVAPAAPATEPLPDYAAMDMEGMPQQTEPVAPPAPITPEMVVDMGMTPVGQLMGDQPLPEVDLSKINLNLDNVPEPVPTVDLTGVDLAARVPGLEPVTAIDPMAIGEVEMPDLAGKGPSSAPVDLESLAEGDIEVTNGKVKSKGGVKREEEAGVEGPEGPAGIMAAPIYDVARAPEVVYDRIRAPEVVYDVMKSTSTEVGQIDLAAKGAQVAAKLESDIESNKDGKLDTVELGYVDGDKLVKASDLNKDGKTTQNELEAVLNGLNKSDMETVLAGLSFAKGGTEVATGESKARASGVQQSAGADLAI